MEKSLGAATPNRKTGNKLFHRGGHGLDFDLLSFWQWSASDLLSNAMRGVLAEYLVARALDVATELREGWSPYDLKTAAGLRVEVKSAAYLQSWHQHKFSRISFGTRPTFAWDSATNLLETARKRQADVYVFCLLAHEDKATIDPLDLEQWRFFVITASRLSDAIGEQKSISLPRLRTVGASETTYEQLAGIVSKVS